MSVTLKSFCRSLPMTVPLELASRLLCCRTLTLVPNGEYAVDITFRELEYEIDVAMGVRHVPDAEVEPVVVPGGGVGSTPLAEEEPIEYTPETLFGLLRKLQKIPFYKVHCCSREGGRKVRVLAEFFNNFIEMVRNVGDEGAGALRGAFDLSRVLDSLRDNSVSAFRHATIGMDQDFLNELLRNSIDNLLERLNDL